MIQLNTKEVDEDLLNTNRPGVDLVFLIDISGSMSG